MLLYAKITLRGQIRRCRDKRLIADFADRTLQNSFFFFVCVCVCVFRDFAQVRILLLLLQ